MNVAQELGDSELYNYDVLVKLLSDRFDPASRVSAFRSRFHGQFRRHHEDADAFADALAELCRVGYPQSPPELRQELIAEQFVRGQSDRELKKYLWVVIRSQKDKKLQTLIEVCTDFSSLTAPTHTHQPAEQNFAVHQPMEASCAEEDCESEAMFAVGDRPPWTGRGASEPSGSPTLQQMFALVRQMGYEMCPIARRWGFALRHVPARTTPRSSVLAVASSDICSLAAHDRTHPYHSNRRAGIYSLTVVNRGMVILHRETLSRPGPHPHRSVRTSFGPHLIFISQLVTGLFIT